MDILDNILDIIEKNLQMISDDNPYKERLYEKYKHYRIMFEANPNDINLSYILPKFLGEVENYMRNNGAPPIREDECFPTILKEDEYVADYNNLSEYIEILSGSLDDINSSLNSKKINTITNHVQLEYEALNYRKQELDQKICGALFQLMIAYLRERKIDEAIETSSKFGVDMRIYLVNYMKQKLITLKEQRKYEQAEIAWKYIYGITDISEKDIRLWQYIYKLEYSEMPNIVETSNNKELVPVSNNEKIPFFIRIKDVFVSLREHTIFRKTTKIKTVHIKNRKGFCEYDSLYNALFKIDRAPNRFLDRKKQDVHIIFDEGIKVVSLSIPNSNRRIFKAHLSKVTFPSSTFVIAKVAFEGASNLKEVDLSETNLKVIQYRAFAETGLEKIILPKSLKQIDTFAFLRCDKLQELDLSETSLETIEDSAFAFSGIKKIVFPSTLKQITSPMFFSMYKVEVIDFSRCKDMNSVVTSCFKCFSLKEIILPKSVKSENWVINLILGLEENKSRDVKVSFK